MRCWSRSVHPSRDSYPRDRLSRIADRARGSCSCSAAPEAVLAELQRKQPRLSVEQDASWKQFYPTGQRSFNHVMKARTAFHFSEGH